MLARLDDKSDGSAFADPSVDAGSDSSVDPFTDAGITDSGPAKPVADALAPSDLTVDGMPCTAPTSQLTTMTGADGKTWSFTLHSTCGAVGSIDVIVTSTDDVPYPQACGARTLVQMSTGSGAMPTTFESTGGGSCAIESGPSTSHESAQVSFQANLVSASGEMHLLGYEKPRPATLSVDGFECTGLTSGGFTKGPPYGKSWTLQVSGTCGADGVVDLYVFSEDDIAYPQSCADDPHIQMSVGGEGDAGYLAYDTTKAGSCTITSGPTVADETTRIVLQGTVGTAAATHVHTFEYSAGVGP